MLSRVHQDTRPFRRVGLGPTVVAAFIALSLFATSVEAQGTGSGSSNAVIRRQEASEAYDRATVFLDRGYYGQAGRWFMTAYRLVPARVALIQAVRSYQQANDLLRAGTLALLLRDEYGADATAISLADQVIHEASVRYHRVEVNCGGCTLQWGERLIDGHALFVEAGRTHRLVFYWGNRQAQQDVSGVAGEVSELEVEAPPEVETSDDMRAGSEGGAATVETYPPLHRGAFITGAALTAVGLGATIWSLVDMYQGVDAYEAQASRYQANYQSCSMTEGCDPTTDASVLQDEADARDLLESGQAREVRSTALLYSTVGIAAVTAIIAIYTDWDGPRYDSGRTRSGDDDDDAEEDRAEESARRGNPLFLRPGFSVSPTGGTLMLEGNL